MIRFTSEETEVALRFDHLENGTRCTMLQGPIGSRDEEKAVRAEVNTRIHPKDAKAVAELFAKNRKAARANGRKIALNKLLLENTERGSSLRKDTLLAYAAAVKDYPILDGMAKTGVISEGEYWAALKI